MTDTPPCLQRFGPLVQLHGPRALQALRLVVLGAKARSNRDGIPMSQADRELIQALADAVDAAGMSPSGHEDVRKAPDSPSLEVLDEISTEEAARMLEVTPRHAQRLLRDLGARKVGGVLLADRDAVLTLAAQRARREVSR